MAITDWPADDRPREKLLLKGSPALSDAELLAIFLRTGVKGISAVDLARQLLNHFGSLRKLISADKSEFCQAKGLGEAKYAQLQAVMEVAKRYLLEDMVREQALESPQDCRDYLIAALRDKPHEVFAAVFLDNRHRVIQFEELSQGTINSASVYPREVLKLALKHNAAAVIFAHNHPSGVTRPSEADKNITQNLKAALALVDIRVLDHFIIGDGKSYSFAEKGLL